MSTERKMKHDSMSAVSGGLVRKPARWRSALTSLLGLALAGPCMSMSPATESAAETPPPAVRHVHTSALEHRVQALAKALELDEKQQVELRNVLRGQRELVARIWNDTSLSSAERVGATHAMSERTADQIRALLTEEQKKKYKPPAPHDLASQLGRPDVERWMNQGPRK